MIQVLSEETGEMIYTWRADADTVHLPVFEPGSYTVRVKDTQTGVVKEIRGVRPESERSGRVVEVKLGG